MESKAKCLGHAVHPMLVVFPLGLLCTAVIFDILYLATGNGRWTEVSFWMIAAGVIGGVAAALFGWIDWFAIPAGTRAKAIGLTHGLGNMLVLALFAVSLYLRYGHETSPGTAAFVCSFLAAALTLFTAWMGGELVERLGVGVDSGAHLDAPSSLSGRPATTSGEGAKVERREAA